jgi:hypothetical protein
MEEIISTGKILRSHCQPKVGVSDGKYQRFQSAGNERKAGTETFVIMLVKKLQALN